LKVQTIRLVTSSALGCKTATLTRQRSCRTARWAAVVSTGEWYGAGSRVCSFIAIVWLRSCANCVVYLLTLLRHCVQVVRYYNDSTILKFICCKGKCNGEPSNVGAPVEGYTQLLYNTVADPFDMHPLTEKPQYAGEIAHLRSLLPTDQWTCGQ
jgi:hypothetical protein